MREASVVLGFEDAALQEEVLHFLERLPGVRVAGAAPDAQGVTARLRASRPDGVVLSPEVLAGVPSLDRVSLFLVSSRETIGDLRLALRAGARGFYLWPQERMDLGRDVARAKAPAAPAAGGRGRVVAVYGPRGGVGVTFVATSLAAACAGRGARTVLVDLDPFYADVTCALGAPANGDAPTVADLLPVLDEIDAEHAERGLYEHPRGFRALLAPPHPEAADAVTARHAVRGIELLRERHDVVVLHLPRGLTEVGRAALGLSDEILVLVSLDVLAFRAAARGIEYLTGLGLRSRCRLVVNRASPGEVVPDDVERVFGLPPLLVIRRSPAVLRALNRGEIATTRSGRLARQFDRLARHVLDGPAGTEEVPIPGRPQAVAGEGRR